MFSERAHHLWKGTTKKVIGTFRFPILKLITCLLSGKHLGFQSNLWSLSPGLNNSPFPWPAPPFVSLCRSDLYFTKVLAYRRYHENFRHLLTGWNQGSATAGLGSCPAHTFLAALGYWYLWMTSQVNLREFSIPNTLGQRISPKPKRKRNQILLLGIRRPESQNVSSFCFIHLPHTC